MLNPLQTIATWTNFDYSGSGQLLRRAWQSLSPLPGGKLLFSRLLGTINPYTGSIGARFVELGPGHAVTQLQERRQVQNHVNSIHAVALMNLAEVTTGLALMFALPADARGLPINLSINYHKKGRGLVTCECRCAPPATSERHETEVTCTIHDGAGVLVADASARWMIGPKAG
jgi:acyl-coenzyme A thioesterase PaaI-like protein